MKNNNTLSEEDLKILKGKALDALSHARHVLLNKYPFIGSIALRMDLVPVRDIRVRTACTDGNSVYFDIAFLSSLSNEERIFVLAHEVWHAVLLHLTRRGTRNPELFNIATDKEVNYLLKEDGLVPPPHLCFPEGKEIGKCAEEIYEMMLKQQKQNQKQQQNGSGNSNSNSSSGSNDSSSSKQKSKSKSNGSSSNNGNKQDNQPSKNGNGGNPNGRLEGQFDKHIYDGDEPKETQKDTNGQSNGSNQPGENGQDNDGDESNGGGGSYTSKITDKYGDVGYDSDFQPKVPKGFADRMRETVISEAQRVEKMKGNVPAHVKELVKKMCAAELDWKELLAQFVTKCYNSGNRSWIPPNRRHVHNDVYLQSRQASKIRLALGIDTSGSTLGDRSKFISELNGLIKSFGRFELTIIECDAQVGDVKHYTQDDDLEYEIDSGNYSMTGGGGTELVHIFDYINENAIEADCIVILTDGYIDNIPKNPTGLPTLWVITKDGTEDFCDWGQKIKLKFNDDDIR